MWLLSTDPLIHTGASCWTRLEITLLYVTLSYKTQVTICCPIVQVDAIKKTLTGMAAAKLNSFHWHITDSHSFPYVSKSQPNLSRYGAYSRDKVYSPQDVAELIQFAKERLERGVDQ